MKKGYLMKAKTDYKSRFRILKGGKISLVVSALLGSVTLSYAAPSGGVVASGNATINQSGKITNINQSTNKASINWQSFGIKADETVNFNQPSINSITLNRVVGNERSVIDGALNANGQVWLLNSNGVLFGKNASINTSGLLATTKELSDTNFQNSNYTFSGNSTNSVINEGTITVQNSGYVVLASNEVVNSGTIEAIKGKVHLTGANEYTINLNGNSLVDLTVNKGVLDALVENSGTIISDGGEVYLTTNAVNELLRGVVNNTGVIEANSLDGVTGKVELFAHGGTANIDGSISAKEGFIETSGKELNVASTTKIVAHTWLLDPTNLVVESSGGSDLTSSSVSATAIQNALSSNIELQADQDITVNEDITWSNATKLTLTAGDEVYVNAVIENTNDTDGGVYFNAANTSDKVIFAGSGKVIVNNINQLQWLNTARNGVYELGSDIDASATSSWNSAAGFTPLGYDSSNKFTGTFDGLGHTISDLVINRPTTYYVGLFGITDTGSVIQNVGLVGGSMSGHYYVGGLVGLNYGDITNAYATGDVSGTINIGGLVGSSSSYSTIKNSYSSVNVTGTNYVGGLAGSLFTGSIEKTYAIGEVTSTGSAVGALIGYSYYGDTYIKYSYWNSDIMATGIGSNGGSNLTDVRGLTTVQMQQQTNFTGFDFATDWIIYDGHTTPLLRTFMTALTVTANDATKTYDGNAYSGASGVTYSVTPDANLLGTASFSGTSQGATNVGTYTITPSGLYSTEQNGGYAITYVDGLLTINPSTSTTTTLNTQQAEINKIITAIVNKNVLTNTDLNTLMNSGIDIRSFINQVKLAGGNLVIIPGIALKVLNGGINLPYGMDREFSLDSTNNQDEKEEENI
jgi:filamentous hemagglutinin family protein